MTHTHPRRRTRNSVSLANSQQCRVCGCTDRDCAQCIQKTGRPCHWVAPDLCSACVDVTDTADRYSADIARVTEQLGGGVLPIDPGNIDWIRAHIRVEHKEPHSIAPGTRR
jgi:hypothetical protein